MSIHTYVLNIYMRVCICSNTNVYFGCLFNCNKYLTIFLFSDFLLSNKSSLWAKETFYTNFWPVFIKCIKATGKGSLCENRSGPVCYLCALFANELWATCLGSVWCWEGEQLPVCVGGGRRASASVICRLIIYGGIMLTPCPPLGSRQSQLGLNCVPS